MAKILGRVLVVLVWFCAVSGAVPLGGGAGWRRGVKWVEDVSADSLGQKSLLDSDVEPKWFEQKLNHFDMEDTRTFQQRFYVREDKFKSLNSPIFLYIGGEGPLRSSDATAGEIVEFGDKLGGGALVVAVEHRYYGESQPFAKLDYESLDYLNVEQALADLANFISSFPYAQYEKAGFENGTHRWVCFGGSYAGAVSSYLRLKYPHLVAASIASSGPTNAKWAFPEYDQTISAALNEYSSECYTVVKKVMDDADVELRSGDPGRIAAMKATLGLSSVVNDTSCLYILADAVSFAVQYNSASTGLLDQLCTNLTKQTTLPAQLGEFSRFLSWLFVRTNSTAGHWDMLHLTDTDPHGPDASSRAWMYQVCDMFGWFQVAPAHNPMRSTAIDVEYHLAVCSALFPNSAGQPVPFAPAVEWVHRVFGGQNPSGTRTFFTNGDVDPWHALGVVNPRTSITREARLIRGTSHCADLHAAEDSDPPSLKSARDAQFYSLHGWLEDEGSCTRGCSGHGSCVFGICHCSGTHYGGLCEQDASDLTENGETKWLWVFLPLLSAGLLLLVAGFAGVLILVFINLPLLYNLRKAVHRKIAALMKGKNAPLVLAESQPFGDTEEYDPAE